jgi:hypothetical protein
MLNLIDNLSIVLDTSNTKIKDFLYTGSKFPNLNTDTNNNGTIEGINAILENTILKRACCMRDDKTIDTKSLYINLPDGTQKAINIVGLIKKCKNLSTGTQKGEFEG